MYCVKPGIPGFLCARVHLFHSRSSTVNAAERRPKNRKCLTKREIIAYQPESVGEEEENGEDREESVGDLQWRPRFAGHCFPLSQTRMQVKSTNTQTHTHTHSFISINLIDFHRSIQLN